MKVKELIQLLQNQDGETDVLLCKQFMPGCDCQYHPIAYIEREDSKDSIVIHPERGYYRRP